ncbi:hypothetical protein [Pseudonocardia sp. N23]|uniref:hypothetical protein n=1 Tax=Pseudonocardia sp. N23 TaxID=1987376 RepID=UPI000BFB4A46|nr:hypothetical protein [Pseudonocardia sp. N23]GAY07666.1 hypothetical protein TOK_3686 [Pseudonocardia sp. N23]
MMATTAASWFWIWPTLAVIGLALLGYVAYRMAQSREPGRPSARRILDERLARGEIDADDYRRRVDLL